MRAILLEYGVLAALVGLGITLIWSTHGFDTTARFLAVVVVWLAPVLGLGAFVNAALSRDPQSRWLNGAIIFLGSLLLSAALLIWVVPPRLYRAAMGMSVFYLALGSVLRFLVERRRRRA